MDSRTLPEHLRGHPNWWLALDMLQQVFPDAVGFDADNIGDSPSSNWISIHIDAPDETVASELWEKLGRPHSNLIVVVTFASYLLGIGPVFLQESNLDRFFIEHVAMFNDLAFSTDFTLLALDTETAIVVTHDGHAAKFQPHGQHDSDVLETNELDLLGSTTRNGAVVRMTFKCPVCGYRGLRKPPRSKVTGAGSYEICPSCGFEFGVTDDDSGYIYERWRQEWIRGGMQWWREGIEPMPDDWDPLAQLRALDRDLG